MVDRLANEYTAAGKPVLFLEQNGQYTTFFHGRRSDRFKASSGNLPPDQYTYPLNMVDSGNQWSFGPVSYYKTYKAMVEAELLRPAMAEVSATGWRVDNHMVVDVKIINLSGTTLLGSLNDAAISVIVYEDITGDTTIIRGHTDRIDRAVALKSIASPLADGASLSVRITTEDLVDAANVNWAKVHAVALVDYRPGGMTGPYDMLQAAMVSDPTFDVQPASLTFQVDPDHLNDPQTTFHFTGVPAGMTWTATTTRAWLTVTPAAGGLTTAPVVKVDATALQPGLNSGTVRFTGSIGNFNEIVDIPVKVTFIPPTLSFQPTGLNFTVYPNDTGPQQATMTVGGSPDNQSWTVTSTPVWLSVTPATGTVGDSVTVTIYPSQLQTGDHVGTVYFTGFAGQFTTTDTVPVHVTVIPPPTISIQPDRLNFIIDPDETINPQVQVTVTGNSAGMVWSVTTETPWLAVSPTSGVVGDTAAVQVDITGLELGVNTGTLHFSATKYDITATKDVVVQVIYHEKMIYFLPVMGR